jgi:hypothetical protein
MALDGCSAAHNLRGVLESGPAAHRALVVLGCLAAGRQSEVRTIAQQR